MITSSFFKYSFLHAKVRPLAAELDQHRIVKTPRTARYSRETLNGENELTSGLDLFFVMLIIRVA